MKNLILLTLLTLMTISCEKYDDSGNFHFGIGVGVWEIFECVAVLFV